MNPARWTAPVSNTTSAGSMGGGGSIPSAEAVGSLITVALLGGVLAAAVIVSTRMKRE